MLSGGIFDMPSKDFIDTGAQPSAFTLGWHRILIANELLAVTSITNLRNKESYRNYIEVLSEVVSAHITGNPDFLSKTPDERALQIARLIERSMAAENYLRKEAIDNTKRFRNSGKNILLRFHALGALWDCMRQSYRETPLQIQKYPDVTRDHILEAIDKTDTESLRRVVAELIEPSLQQDIYAASRVGKQQLLLTLTSK